MFSPTASLSFLWVLKPWLTELNPSGDVIALRFLLFLSHTYGAALLLTTFLIAMETLIRVLWPHVAVDPGTVDYNGEVGEHSSLPQVVGFFCCLSVWVTVAFSVRWHVKLEEGWTAACLVSTDSLVRCLPNFFSPMHSVMNPYWSVAFLILLGLFLTISTGLQRRNQTSAEPKRTEQYQNGLGQALDRATPDAFQPVHPEMWMSKCVDRDSALASRDCLSEKSGGQELKRTREHVPLDLIRGQRSDSKQASLSRWQLCGFPNLEEKTVIGFIGTLSVFTLPFYLSVNILLIRTIDALLQGCIKTLLSSAANCRDISVSRSVTQV